MAARLTLDHIVKAALHQRLSGGVFDAQAYDRDMPARTQATLY